MRAPKAGKGIELNRFVLCKHISPLRPQYTCSCIFNSICVVSLFIALIKFLMGVVQDAIGDLAHLL